MQKVHYDLPKRDANNITICMPNLEFLYEISYSLEYTTLIKEEQIV